MYLVLLKSIEATSLSCASLKNTGNISELDKRMKTDNVNVILA